MIRYNDHILYRNHDDRTDLPYVYYIKGEKLALMVDAGNSPASYHAFIQELEEEGLKEPDLMVLSHWHWDHTFGLPAVKCPVIASEKTDAYLEKAMAWEWNEEAMLERLAAGEDIEFCHEKMHEEFSDITAIQVRRPDIVFEGTMHIDLGGVPVILQTIDTPHTRDAVMVYLPEDRILFAADAEYEDYYDNNSMYDPLRLQNYITYLENLDFEIYMRGHDDTAIPKENILQLLKDAQI